MTYSGIGKVLHYQGNYNDVLEEYLKALTIRKKLLGTEHPDMAKTYNNIGSALLAQGDHTGALDHYQKASAIQENVLGKNYIDARSLDKNKIGRVLHEKGEYEAACWSIERRLFSFGRNGSSKYSKTV